MLKKRFGFSGNHRGTLSEDHGFIEKKTKAFGVVYFVRQKFLSRGSSILK